jgi:hypothetical protein
VAVANSNRKPEPCLALKAELTVVKFDNVNPSQIPYAEITESRIFLGIGDTLFVYILPTLQLIAKCRLPSVITCGCAVSERHVFLGLVHGGWTLRGLAPGVGVDVDVLGVANFHVIAEKQDATDVVVFAQRTDTGGGVVFSTIRGKIKILQVAENPDGSVGESAVVTDGDEDTDDNFRLANLV